MPEDARNDNLTNNSGVRRRHSGQHDCDDMTLPKEEDANTITEVLGGIRRSATEPVRPISSGNDVPSLSTQEVMGQPSRVRFSIDAHNTSQHRGGKRRKSSESIKEAEDGIDKRPKTPNLSVDIELAASGSAVPAENVAISPSGLDSQSSRIRPQIASQSPTSARVRGYSLRSSLFQRNLRDRPVGEVLEMTAVGPSNQAAHSRQLSRQYTRPQNEKKSMDTFVEISPVLDHESQQDWKMPFAEPRGGGEGTVALANYRSWIQELAARNPAWHSMRQAYSRARKFVLRINEIPPSKDGRHIDLDLSRKETLLDERTGKEYIGNSIRSTRYSAWSFVPRQLFAQFSKLANFYFLCISILQMIPGLSTTGTYTTIIPLLFFVALSIAKEGYDDLRRYRLDKVENNHETAVLRAYRPDAAPAHVDDGVPTFDEGSMHWSKIKWQNIKVGDIVKLERNEAAPADLVLLNAKGPNGIAYIETMALDGETNLKSKQTAPSLAKLCNTREAIFSCNAHFVVEDPNLDLYNFEGKVTVSGQTAPLTNNEIVYRGSILRNTSEAIGMVLYSGEECKIRMNANKNPRIKAPSLQAVVNQIVVFIVIFVIALAIFNTVAYKVWKEKVEDKAWYLTNASVSFFPILTSFIILFNTMIPLSLYVSLEIVKLGQMFLLNDIDMYDEASNTPFEARTSTINEELGQISYIFSDKTGTLTDNSMKFRKLSVAGTAWLHDADLQGTEHPGEMLIHKKRRPKDKGKKPLRKSRGSTTLLDDRYPDDLEPAIERPSRASTSQWQSSARPAKAQLELNTRDMIRYLQRRPLTLFARKTRMLLLSMALCHSCLPETKEDGSIDFQASSPDELALVRAAQELDYMVVDRDSGTVTVRTYPSGNQHDSVDEQYEILDVIEFSSKRKRMSVTVRFPDGRICVICKGADTVVMQRLKLATLANQKVVEIERRASKRKSLEAHEAILRKSEHHERVSMARPSISLSLGGRTSVGAVPRLSTSGLKRRNELNNWLSEREHDVDVLHEEDASNDYSPRPSTHLAGRPSNALSDARGSLQIDDEDEELVEEALVLDEATVVERCFQHINDFATEGLRTLLYGHRFLDEEQYLTWKKVYHDATTSLTNRQRMIEDAGELIEQNLELGGATAIEDKLQKGVPEAIDKLRRANIKMWMLTGDKRETAINIGHSCRLIKDYSSITILDHETGEVEQRIAATILDINDNKVAHSVIVVDGQTLAVIEADMPLRALFYELAILTDSVICCRASPNQKASLVKAVRNRVKGSITLAIGDGANDIAMIQEAHVGIGITGKEGLQAARTSDYSIAQFRFLTKLLLVHGRWNYIRVCKYIAGTFYKEFMFYLIQALYQRWTGYTGTSLYESWSLSLFNTLFTSLPVIFLGIFEKDLLPQTLLAVPELYTKGQHNGGFNVRVYLGWIFMGTCEAMAIFFLMRGLYGRAIFTGGGQDLYALGSLCFTACVILIVTKLQVLEIHNKSIMAVIAYVCSVGGWFLWMIILSGVYTNNNEYDVKDGFFNRFGRNGGWWLTLILIVACTVCFELGVRSLKAAYLPTDVDIFQDLERDLAVRKRFEEASALELQAGWHHGTKKSSFEVQREQAAQAQRENDVQDLLNRPRVMEEGGAGKVSVITEEERVFVEDGPLRRSTDIQEMLSRRFGSVRQGRLMSTKERRI